jgi:glutaminyl-peptide cyclotransferase
LSETQSVVQYLAIPAAGKPRVQGSSSVLLYCALFLSSLSSTAFPGIPTYTYEVVHAYPHDSSAFTQGLFYRGGFLYESTGLQGRSSVRKVRLQTGEVLRRVELPPEYFGEGMTYWGDRLLLLTWTTHTGFVFDLPTFVLQDRFEYLGQGWGLTRSDEALIMSDGTSQLRFLAPRTLREMRRIRVTAGGRPVDQLNELEWVKGEIFANIWRTDRIARIDPWTGRVTGWIDLTGILSSAIRAPGHPDVLNGIAYDRVGDRLFVTGKLWPRVFEIRLVRKGDGANVSTKSVSVRPAPQ